MSTQKIQQPNSLPIFCGTEMWERYGFYVVQALLALYLAHYFEWEDTYTYGLVGSFTALTYLSPVLGGWIADKLLGQKISIILGAILLFFSYASLALFESKTALTASLAGIAIGTGLLKPNISSLLGNAYPENSLQRERGFIIFYMGITLGIILGTTLPSIIHQFYGWAVTFASAAFGMILSLSTFIYGMYYYDIQNYHPQKLTFKKILFALSCLLLTWIVAFCILTYPALANGTFSFVILFSTCFILYTAKHESREQAKKTLVIGLLCIVSVLFWAFYFQMFTSLTLFIARATESHLFGIPFPPPYYVGVQSIGMMIFAFFLAKNPLVHTTEQRGIEVARKFLGAMLLMSMAYLFITCAIYFSNPFRLLSPFMILPAFLIISLAELLLSPVGLYAITILASTKKISTMMGIFFVSLGVGGFLSGKLAILTAIEPAAVNQMELHRHYAIAFSQMLGILCVATLICVVLFYVIKGLLKEPTPPKLS